MKDIKCTVVYAKDDFAIAKKILAKLSDNEYYSMGVGRHRAIVTKQKGKYYFAEMQSPNMAENKFYELTDKILEIRFKCNSGKSNIKSGSMFNIKNVANSKDFMKLMQYPNTKETEQIKGIGGGIT